MNKSKLDTSSHRRTRSGRDKQALDADSFKSFPLKNALVFLCLPTSHPFAQNLVNQLKEEGAVR